MPGETDPLKRLAEMDFSSMEDELARANSADTGSDVEPVLDAGKSSAPESKEKTDTIIKAAVAQIESNTQHFRDLATAIRKLIDDGKIKEANDDLDAVRNDPRELTAGLSEEANRTNYAESAIGPTLMKCIKELNLIFSQLEQELAEKTKVELGASKEKIAYKQYEEVLRQQNALELEIRDSFKWLVHLSEDDLQAVKAKREEFVRMEAELLRLLAEAGEDEQTIKDAKKEGEEHLTEIDKLISDAEKRLAGAGAGDTSSPGDTLTPQEKLDEAREKFAVAKKQVEELDSLRVRFLKVGGGAQVVDLERKLTEAKEDYERCLREMNFADRQQILTEKTKLEDAKLETYRRERGFVHKALDWNRRLSGFSAEKLVSKEFKEKHKWLATGLRMVNGRTVVSAGLLTGSAFATFGGSVVLGLGLGAARASWSFVGSGLGTYGAMTGGREAWKMRTTGKEIESMDAEKVEENIARLQARASLDARELKNNPLYAQLLARREKFSTEKGAATPDEIEAELVKLFGPVDEEFKKQLRKEKRFEKLAAGVSLIVASVSAGWILRRAQNAYELKQAAEQLNLLKGASRGADIVLPKPPLESHSIVEPPYAETPQGVPGQNISPEGLVTEAPKPGVGVGQEAVPTGAEPIIKGTTLKADYGMEVNVKPTGVTETPVPAVEAPPSNTVVGSGLAETSPTGVGKIINHLDIRSGSGASIDIGEAGDAVVHAGKRGIEGALLDLKATDPDRYAKMLAKLQEHYGTGDSGKAENLIHRFILDNSDGKDLNRVFSANVHIGADGELSLGDVKLMPSVGHAVDAAGEANPPSGGGATSNVDFHSKSGGSGFNEIFSDKVHVPKNPAQGIFSEFQKGTHGASALDTAGSDFEPSDLHDTASESVDAIQHAKDVAAESILSADKIPGKVEKLSDSLQLMLGQVESKAFLKTLGIKSAATLNKIQEHTFAWLVKEKATNPLSANKFDVLIDTIKELKETKGWDWRYVNGLPLKKVFIELAKEARK